MNLFLGLPHTDHDLIQENTYEPIRLVWTTFSRMYVDNKTRKKKKNSLSFQKLRRVGYYMHKDTEILFPIPIVGKGANPEETRPTT
jgi:hypothetical protein